MKIIFNEIGVITSIDTTDEPIRQGNVGVNNLIVDFSNMNGVNNLDYACVFTYVRPDKSKINDVIMLSSAENTKYFEFNFSNKWFFELYGDASITVKLLKDNTVLANGEFNIVIEKTSADNEPQITYDEYLHLVESIAKTQQDAKQYTDDSVQALKDLVSENYAEKTYVDNQLNLCVKLTDIDTDLSLTSTNPIQNKVVSKQIKDINYTIMTMKEELFETILSEVDYKVDYATIYPIPETLSDDDGTHRVVYSDTQLKEIEGNSVAFNQLIDNQGNSQTINGITFTNNGDGTWTVGSGTATGNSGKTPYSNVNAPTWIKDHKYLVKLSGFTANGVKLIKNSNGFTIYQSTIITQSSNEFESAYPRIYVPNGTTIDSDTRVSVQIFDLSLMFGAGNEPTTVAEFNRIFPNAYYPYNAGEIKSTVIKGVKVNGYNAFDEEIEIGSISTANGTNEANNNVFRSVNYTKVITGQTYSLEIANYPQWQARAIFEYDDNKNFIKYSADWSHSENAKVITLSNNTRYIRFRVSSTSIGGVLPTNPQIAFHLTGSRTGYAPYKEPHIIQIPQTELLSAGSAHDTIKFVEGNVVAGQQRYNMVRVSRINNVDLGTLNWNGSNGNFAYDLKSLGFANKNLNVAQIICSKYAIGTSSMDKSIRSNGGYIAIYDSSYTDQTAFKTAMSGVMLNYEKAEPTETTLATDLTFEEVSAIIEQGGSIETIFEIVPPNLKTAFVVNKAIVS